MFRNLIVRFFLVFLIVIAGALSASAQDGRAEPRASFVATTLASGMITFRTMPDAEDGIDISGGAQLEAGEQTPSCGSKGNYSVWFSVYHPGGTLIVDTSYFTGSNFNTIAQVFNYDTASTATLTEVACDDNSGGGAGGDDARISAELPSAAYIVRIACLGCAFGPTDLAVSVSFIPPAGSAPANDTLLGATDVTFNAPLRSYDVEFATLTVNENLTLSSCPMYNSVWYRLVTPRNGNYSFSTIGSRIIRNSNSGDTKLAVYYTLGGLGFDDLTEVGCSDNEYGSQYASVLGIPFSAAAVVYIRVGTPTQTNMLDNSYYRLTVSPERMIDIGDNAYFVNGLDGWTLKNTTAGDGLVDVGGGYELALYGAPGKTSKAIYKVDPDSVLLTNAEDSAVITTYINYHTAGTTSSSAKFMVKIKYEDGTPATKVSAPTLQNVPGSHAIGLDAVIESKKVKDFSVIVKNSSPEGVLRVWSVEMTYYGNAVRDAKSDSLLPLPAPAWRSGDAATFRGQN